MFHSPSFTYRLLHRLRTTASCLWLHVAPHSTLPGCRYRFKLSIDPRFPEVPASPGFPSTPCTVTSASEAILCGKRYALSIRPTGRTFPPRLFFRFVPAVGCARCEASEDDPIAHSPVQHSLSTRSPGHFLPGAVSRSPNNSGCADAHPVMESKGRVSPPSAPRSRTSPIRGMRLQRLLVT